MLQRLFVWPQATPATSVMGGSDGMVWEIYFLPVECNELDRKYSPIINGRKEGAGCIKGMALIAVDILGVLNTVFAVFPSSPPSGFCGFNKSFP